MEEEPLMDWARLRVFLWGGLFGGVLGFLLGPYRRRELLHGGLAEQANEFEDVPCRAADDGFT